MASKTISLTEDVYQLLKAIKLPNESFGEVIKRLCEEKLGKNLISWIENKTMWSDMSKDEIEGFNNAINASKITLKEVDL